MQILSARSSIKYETITFEFNSSCGSFSTAQPERSSSVLLLLPLELLPWVLPLLLALPLLALNGCLLTPLDTNIWKGREPPLPRSAGFDVEQGRAEVVPSFGLDQAPVLCSKKPLGLLVFGMPTRRTRYGKRGLFFPNLSRSRQRSKSLPEHELSFDELNQGKGFSTAVYLVWLTLTATHNHSPLSLAQISTARPSN